MIAAPAHPTCVVVSALHAFRCPLYSGGSVYLRLRVRDGRIMLVTFGEVK